MVIIGFLIILVLCVYGVWKLVLRAPRQRFDWSIVWRMASLIAALRISALWAGLAAFRDSGWAQIPGYFLLMTGLPDIYVVKSIRSEPLLWGTLASAILAATSVFWSAALIWLMDRLRRQRHFNL